MPSKEIPEVPKKVGDAVGPTCLADIAKGASDNGDCGTDAHTPPAWLDHDKYTAGRKVFEKHAFNFVVNFHFSLVMGMCVKPFIQALIFTGQSSTPSDAIKRYINTYKFLASWHLGDIFDDTQSTNGMSAYDSVQAVRTFHKTVRGKMSAALPDDQKYMNQYDMALVQTGFMGALVTCPKGSGMDLSQEDIDNYVYFWKCVAHQLGVADEYNLCGLGNPTATNITWEVVNQVVIPSEDDPPEPDYDTLINAYLDGMNGGLKIWTLNAMLAYSYGMLGFDFPRKLSCGDRVRVAAYRLMVWMLLYAPGLAYVANAVALCATKMMLKNWSMNSCSGQGICPVAGTIKNPEEMQALKEKCPGARSAAEKETFIERFSRKATIGAGVVAVFGIALFWITVVLGSVAYGTHLALQYAM